ncbi:MAG TPA: hypothetical protein V6C58_21215, partial [Allocoleopsis sp.]
AMVQYRIHSASMYQQKSPAYRDHELRTVEKHLGYSKEADAGIKKYIYEESIILFINNGDRKVYWLYKRFMYKKSLKNFLNLSIASLGISYEVKNKILRAMKISNLL